MDYKTLFEKIPPSRLFTIVAIPGLVSMLVSSLYQLIDGAFVGKFLGEEAFAALNLVMPIVIINFSVADLIGVGSAVPIAINLGKKDEKTASNIFSCACLIIVGAGALLGIILYIFADDIVRLMGADEALIIMASQYLRVYAVCSPFTTIVFAVDNYLRICGKVRFSMMVNIFMSVASAALEFLFLFVLKFGIWGAAAATCIGMFLSAVVALIPFIRGKLQLRFSKPKISRDVFLSILSNGCPSFLNNVAGRITSIIMNIYLLQLGGAVAVSAYGILMYADGFIQPMLYGLCDSLQPAIGYNWGAGNYVRIKAIEKRCFCFCCVLSVFMTVLLLTTKTILVGFFIKGDNTDLTALAVHALSLFAYAYLVRWISFATQSYMSAVGRAGYATIISISTAFIFPLIFIFALEGLGLDGLWLNLPFTALMTAVLSVVFLLRFKKECIKI